MSRRPSLIRTNSTPHDANWQVPPKDSPHRLKRMESIQVQSYKPKIISDSRRRIEDLCRDLIVNNDHIHVIEQRLRLSISKGLKKYVFLGMKIISRIIATYSPD